MPPYTALEKTLMTALSTLNTCKDMPAHGNWTRFVAKKIAGVAADHGCEPFGHGCVHHEFMYDITWLKRDKKGSVLDVKLVMECEWGNDQHVLEDFRKLLLARAGTRLMVFEGKTVETNAKLMETMRGEVRSFSKTKSGDRYLFAHWPKKDGSGFQFDMYVA